MCLACLLGLSAKPASAAERQSLTFDLPISSQRITQMLIAGWRAREQPEQTRPLNDILPPATQR
jgi:hypothetical protein